MRTNALAGVFVGCVLLAGCHHRQQPVPAIILPPMTQVPVEPIPQPPTPPKVPSETAGPAPEASVTPPKKVKKPRRRPPPAPPAPAPAAVAPVQIAGTGAPPASAADVIGALSTGGDSTPDKRDKATALIAASEKRLKSLPESVQGRRAEVERVRYFCDQATAALKGGDTDGALTLATKAKVLLDELLQ